jgi:hypothetical protein
MVKRKNKKGGAAAAEPIETEVPSPQPLQSESITEKLTRMNAWDCCKDAKSSIYTVRDDRNNDFNTMLQLLFGNISGSNNWVGDWKSNLNSIFKEFMQYTKLEEEEVVFERNGISVEKLPQKYFFNESGMGGKRVSVLYDAIEINTGAQFVDEGPGSGDLNYKIPKNGEYISFNEDYFKSIGFPTIIKSWKCTGQNDSLLPPYSYEIELQDQVKIVDPNELRVSNPDKNESINSFGNTAENIKKILFKELGDTMQTMIYKYFLDNSTIDQLSYKALMLTCDKTVHYRNIMLGLPSCYTTSNKEDQNMPSTKIGRIFLPITEPKEKLKSLLEMEYQITLKNNIGIQKLVSSIRFNQSSFYYFILKRRNQRRQRRTVAPEMVTTVLNNILAINYNLYLKYDEYKRNIEEDQTTIQYDEMKIEIQSTFKKYFIPPFFTSIKLGSCLNINLFKQESLQPLLSTPLSELIINIKSFIPQDVLNQYGGIKRSRNNEYNNPSKKRKISIDNYILEKINFNNEELTENEKYLIEKIYPDIILQYKYLPQEEKFELTYIYYCVCIYFLHRNRNGSFINNDYIDDEENTANLRLDNSIKELKGILYEEPPPPLTAPPAAAKNFLQQPRGIRAGGRKSKKNNKKDKKRKILRKTKNNKNKLRKTHKKKNRQDKKRNPSITTTS